MGVAMIGGLIGRMFGNQSVPQSYAQARRVPQPAEPKDTQGGDVVELSENAPLPLNTEILEQARNLASRMAAGKTVSGSEQTRLREDRVFAALVTLSRMQMDTGSTPSWPGGFPAPTGEELDVAYRRLTQRLMRMDQSRDPEQMQVYRETMIDTYRDADFPNLASAWFGEE